MKSKIKHLIKGYLLLTFILFFTGCGQKTSKEPLQETPPHSSNETAETTQPEQVSKPIPETDVTDSLPTDMQLTMIKEEITNGLSMMETIKIKEAFHLMNKTLTLSENLTVEDMQVIINDLQSIYNISENEIFKEDLRTMQKLIQYDINNGEQIGKKHFLKILNDLTYYCLDYPYDVNSIHALGDFLERDLEVTFYKTAKAHGYSYSEEVERLIDNTEVQTTTVFDLRTYAMQLDLLIWDAFRENNNLTTEELKNYSLEIGRLLEELRVKLKSSEEHYETLPTYISEIFNLATQKLEICMSGLASKPLKEEYMKVYELLNYCQQETLKSDYDYNTVLLSIMRSQEIIDDLYLIASINSDSFEINKQYSAATTLMEGIPVKYDFFKIALGGEYPESGTPSKNHFGYPLHVEPAGIKFPKDFDETNDFIISSFHLGSVTSNSDKLDKITSEFKLKKQKELEEKYKDEIIPADESGYLTVFTDEVLAPNGLDIQIHASYPDFKIDSLGWVDMSRFHIRLKNPPSEDFNIYLKLATKSCPIEPLELFTDSHNGQVYWNAVFFETVNPDELNDAYIILKK